MVWLGGAVKEKGIAVDKLGCQVDISFTLLRQLGLKGDYYFIHACRRIQFLCILYILLKALLSLPYICGYL